MRLRIVIVFFLINLSCFAKDYLIKGRVVDSDGYPIKGATVYQALTDNQCFTLPDGSFELYLRSEYDAVLSVHKIGYYPYNLVFRFDQLEAIPTHIVLRKNSAMITDTEPYIGGSKFVLALQINVLDLNADEFVSVLGQKNVDYLNQPIATVGVKFGGLVKPYLILAGEFTLSFNENLENKEFVQKVNATNYGVFAGFPLINSRTFWIAPQFGIKWYRLRLINGSIEQSIPIEEYVANKELDMRFNQTFGFLGGDFSYRLAKHFPDELLNHFGFGCTLGYLFKLNSSPWVYSKETTLKTSKEFGVSNFSWGITFSLHF